MGLYLGTTPIKGVATGDAAVTPNLPELTNPVTADKMLSGYEAIDANGEIITGTGDSDLAAGNIVEGVNIFGVTGTAEPASALASELTTQDDLIAQINAALEGKSAGSGVDIAQHIGDRINTVYYSGITHNSLTLSLTNVASDHGLLFVIDPTSSGYNWCEAIFSIDWANNVAEPKANNDSMFVSISVNSSAYQITYNKNYSTQFALMYVDL